MQGNDNLLSNPPCSSGSNKAKLSQEAAGSLRRLAWLLFIWGTCGCPGNALRGRCHFIFEMINLESDRGSEAFLLQ